MALMTTEDLRRRRAIRQALQRQEGSCASCAQTLDPETAIVDGVTLGQEHWVWAQAVCAPCAAGTVTMELERELFMEVVKQENDERDRRAG